MKRTKRFTRYHNRMPSEGAIVAAINLAKLIVQENRQYGTLKRLVPYAEQILAGQAEPAK